MSQKLKYKFTGNPAWDTKQHAHHLCSKISKNDIDPKENVAGQIEALIGEKASASHKEVLKKQFTFFFDEPEEPKEPETEKTEETETEEPKEPEKATTKKATTKKATTKKK